jgi:hypothetical protein
MDGAACVAILLKRAAQPPTSHRMKQMLSEFLLQSPLVGSEPDL